MAINETVKLVLAVLLGCALLLGVQTVLDWKQAAQQNEQRGRTLEATSGITNDGQLADANRQATDAGVAQGRDQFNRQLEEGNRNEPETAARGNRSVPASRLRAFRERRLARERLGCVGEQCESRPADPAPTKR